MGYLHYFSNIENLVLRARSLMIGSAIDEICSWFSAGGGSVNILNTDLVATEGQHR
jgi:hypothetical protein